MPTRFVMNKPTRSPDEEVRLRASMYLNSLSDGQLLKLGTDGVMDQVDALIQGAAETLPFYKGTKKRFIRSMKSGHWYAFLRLGVALNVCGVTFKQEVQKILRGGQ